VPLLVSLTRKRFTYLALELDRSWTENGGVTPKPGTAFLGIAFIFLRFLPAPDRGPTSARFPETSPRCALSELHLVCTEEKAFYNANKLATAMTACQPGTRSQADRLLLNRQPAG